MNISDVGICNIALAELGEKRITNFTDGSKAAGLCSTFYPVALEQTLTMHPWNFSVTRATELAARASAPEWGYEFAYTFPSDGLRVLTVGKNGITLDKELWEVEIDPATDEKIIVTDCDAPIDIKYIKRIETTARFSPPFVLALSKMLKTMLARPCTGKAEAFAEAKADLMAFMREAKTADGQEGMPDEYGPTDLEDVR